MKNILKHNGTSQLLLSNVDDGTNRIFVNDEEIPSNLWIGNYSYVILIDGHPVGIQQISDDSGNIMLQKVSDNDYKLVRKADALTFSHVGQIIHSTTLATLEDVQAIYGSDTTWIQHSGYILRGASSGVTANNAAKDGGEDTHKLTTNEIPAHTHGKKTLTGTFGATDSQFHWNWGGSGIISAQYRNSGYMIQRVANVSGSQPYQITVNATHEHDSVGGGAAHNNMQSYKNVYIWERTA